MNINGLAKRKTTTRAGKSIQSTKNLQTYIYHVRVFAYRIDYKHKESFLQRILDSISICKFYLSEATNTLY